MSVEEHTAADSAAGPYALTTGPDGALWFTETAASQSRGPPDPRIRLSDTEDRPDDTAPGHRVAAGGPPGFA